MKSWQSPSLWVRLPAMSRLVQRRTVIAATLVIPTFAGCAAIRKVIAKVLPIVVELAELLDAIDARAQEHFKQNPDADAEKTYAQIMAKAHLALSTVTRVAKGVEAAGDQDLEAAFSEFKKAYGDILALLGPLGVVVPTDDGTFSAPGDGGPLQVPAPDTLTLE